MNRPIHTIHCGKRLAALLLLGLALCCSTAGAEEGLALQLSFEGLSDAQEENARAMLDLTKVDEARTALQWRRLYRRAPEQIRTALRALGHYEPRISGEFSREEGQVRIVFRVDPGPAVILSDVTIHFSGPGENDDALQALLNELPLQAGEVLNHGTYEKTKDLLHSRLLERGYFDARFSEHRLEVYVDENRAHAVLVMETGLRYRFGPVRIEQDVLNEDFVRRYLTFERGRPYSQQALLDFRTGLIDSGYFQRVEVFPLPDETRDGVIPIVARLSARKKHEYSLGVGYGTDSGPRLSAGWENRRFNRRGHKIDTELALSGLRTALTADYEIPLQEPQKERLIYQFGYKDEDIDGRITESQVLGVRHVRQRSRDWAETRFLTLQREEFEIGDEKQISRLLIPGVTLSTLQADDRMNPQRGYRLSLTAKGAHDALLSDTTILQLIGNAKLVRSLGDKGRLLLRGEAAVSLLDRFAEVPTSLRFFAGGDQSIRGYGYQTLGPVDENQTVVGGRHLLVGSLEYDWRVRDRWRVAAFIDGGNAFDDLDMAMKTSVGAGLRWISPVGPIRVDVATPLEDGGWRLHVYMGPDL